MKAKDILYENIVEIHQQIYYFALSRTGQKDAAEEIAQTTIEKCYRKLHTLRKTEALRTWIKQIAANEIKNYFRSISRYQKLFQGSDTEFAAELSLIEDGEASISHMLERQETTQRAMEIYEKLDEKYKAIIRLHVFNEYSFADISRLYDVNVNTVRTQYARAIRRMNEELEKAEKERARHDREEE